MTEEELKTLDTYCVLVYEINNKIDALEKELTPLCQKLGELYVTLSKKTQETIRTPSQSVRSNWFLVDALSLPVKFIPRSEVKDE